MVQQQSMSTTTINAKLQRVLDMPSIPQRTPEWYAARHNLITASSCADALGLNPYNRNARQVLLESKGTPGECLSGPMGNVFTVHGTRFEPVATMMYTTIFGPPVYEIGLLRHPEIPFLGASPDGLCPDGTMLEIKCPMKRKIKKSGQIRGTVVPTHYWIQVQVQLECCDLDVCDFWQCEFVEFSTFEDWKEWKPEKPILVAKQPEYKEWNSNKRKGMYILLKDGSCIYPEQFYDTEAEWCMWSQEKLSSGILSDVDKIVYWRMDDCFNQPIHRDKAWFTDDAYPKFKTFWEEVEDMRAKGGPPPLSFF